VTTLTAYRPQGVRQRSVRDLRDSNGNGGVIETILEFRDDGVYLDSLKITTTNGPISDVRELRPAKPVKVARTGAQVGDHVQFTMSGSNTEARVTIDIVRRQRLAVGSRSIDTVLVRSVTRFSGELQGESTSDTWYDPRHLLPVKEHVVTDARVGPNSVHTEYRAELQRAPG
jgi:hypothetical protein